MFVLLIVKKNFINNFNIAVTKHAVFKQAKNTFL